MRYHRAELPLTLDGLDAARSYFAGCIADSDPTQESLWVAHLDDESRCIHLSRHLGNGDAVDFPLREIIGDAATHGSRGIVLAHNHPSGDSRPSDSDLRSTRRLAVAAEALDVAVLDHLVFGAADCASMRQMGYL
jgi:DNA repair protein RadC